MPRIKDLPLATLPFAGTETVPISQGGVAKKAPINLVGTSGAVDVDVTDGNVALSTRNAIITVIGSHGAPRTLTLDDPGAGNGYLCVIHNDSDSDLKVQHPTSSVFTIGAGLSQLVAVTHSGVRNAVTGV